MITFVTAHTDIGLMMTFFLRPTPAQAKEHEIYDATPFLRSRLFTANGYTLNGDVIEKRFKQQG